MRSKNFIFIFAFLLIVISSFGIVSAYSCSFTSGSCDPQNIAFRTYSTSGGLGSNYLDDGATYKLCCDFAIGQQRTCYDGANRIIGLEGQTAEEASEPGMADPNYDVCGYDVECAAYQEGNAGAPLTSPPMTGLAISGDRPPGYDIDMYSLDLGSNARIYSFGGAAIDVVCKLGDAECSIASDCGTDGWITGTETCTSGEVYKDYKTWSCNSESCSSSTSSTQFEDCTNDDCSGGVCGTSSCDDPLTDSTTGSWSGTEYCEAGSQAFTINTIDTCANGEDISFVIYQSPSTAIESLAPVSVSSGSASNSWTIPTGSTGNYYFKAVIGSDTKTFSDLMSYNAANCGTKSVSGSTAGWWDQYSIAEYTNQEQDHPTFQENANDADTITGKIIISGITGFDGEQAKIDIYKEGTSYAYETVTISGTTATGTWTIAKGDLVGDYDSFTPNITIIDEPSYAKTFTDWMNVSIVQSVICDISLGTLSWSNSAPTITEGSNYNAGISISGINAVDTTQMTLKIYNVNSGTPISTETVTVSSNSISSSYLFEDLSLGTHTYYFTLDGCTSQQEISENMIITVEESGCSYNVGDGTCCATDGETCSNSVADCGECAPSLTNAIGNWWKNGAINTTDTILSGSINNAYQMKITGIENADEDTLYFDVYEYDLGNSDETLQVGITATVSGGEALATFSFNEATLEAINEFGEPPYKLYFQARLGTLKKDYVDIKLEVDVVEPTGCGYDLDDGICCTAEGETYPTEPTCAAPPMDISGAIGSWIEDNVTMIEGTSVSTGFSISGITNVPAGGEQVGIQFWEEDTILRGEGSSDDHTKTAYITIAEDGTFSGDLSILQSDITQAGGDENIGTSKSPYEFYLILTYNGDEKDLEDKLEVFVDNTETCEIFRTNGNLCNNYTDSGQCSADTCGVNESSGAAVDINCALDEISCYCSWNMTANECKFGYDYTTPDGTKIGSCAYDEDDSGDANGCADGFLSYTWTGNWFWDETNFGFATDQGEGYVQDLVDGKWYYDPLEYNKECVDGQKTIACPAKVQLPGFNWVNLIVALIIIGIIYGLFEWDKKNKSKKKAKKVIKKKTQTKKSKK